MTRPEQLKNLIDEDALQKSREKRRKVDESVSEKVSITKRMYGALDTCIKNIGERSGIVALLAFVCAARGLLSCWARVTAGVGVVLRRAHASDRLPMPLSLCAPRSGIAMRRRRNRQAGEGRQGELWGHARYPISGAGNVRGGIYSLWLHFTTYNPPACRCT